MRGRARGNNPHIDRKKHEVDITERVLQGGVWAGPSRDGRSHIVSTETRPSSADPIASAGAERPKRDDIER